jgi:peptidoglycan hydrolase CwlO-like protein
MELYQSKLQQSSDEMDKGNGVIAQLSAECKQLKERLKLKSEVLRRQV